MGKLITLEQWAELIFGSKKPHRNTLLNWRRNGRIIPRPIKCGGRYFVEPDAIYCDDAGEMNRRFRSGSA
jgi:hypothetical protein